LCGFFFYLSLKYISYFHNILYFCYFMCWWNILFYMCEYCDAIKIPKSYSPPPLVGRGYGLSHFWLFMLYVRGNFKNVTIDLAIHSHSAPIFRLRCISIARKKSYIYGHIFEISPYK
jgi:hypothetical protein